MVLNLAGLRRLGKLVKNAFLGLFIMVHLETNGRIVGKLSEEEYPKCGHHAVHGTIGWGPTWNKS